MAFFSSRLSVRGINDYANNIKVPAVPPYYHNKGKVMLCYRGNQVLSTTFKLKKGGNVGREVLRFAINLII